MQDIKIVYFNIALSFCVVTVVYSVMILCETLVSMAT